MEKFNRITEIDLDKELLVYRAEGNANLVMSLPTDNLILRIRKKSRKDLDYKKVNQLKQQEQHHLQQNQHYKGQVLFF